MTVRARGAADRDEGRILLLSFALAAVVALLVVVIASATAVHLERKRLLALADLLAVEAAADVGAAVLIDGSPLPQATIPLTTPQVRDSVEDRLAQDPGPASRLTQLEVLEAHSPDGRSAVVRLRCVARPPLVPWMLVPWSDGIEIEVTSRARAW